MHFELVSEIENVLTIAVIRSVRALKRLRRIYGAGRWRKLKGTANVRLSNGNVRLAEVHWYEAHGIGRRGMKVNDS